MSTLTETRLSPETIIKTIEKEGYCLLPELMDRVTLEEARNALAEILEREQPEKGLNSETQTTRTWAIMLKHPVFRRMPQHPLVLDVYRRMLGPDMVLQSMSVNTVTPGHDRMHWHSDHPYHMAPPWPKDVLACQSLWFLDDFTDENGATALVPKSHKKNHKPDIPLNEPHPDQILAEAPAGSLLLFDARLWHSSRGNRTKQNRSCVIATYNRTYVIPFDQISKQLEQMADPTDEERLLFGGKQWKVKNTLEETVVY